MISFKSAGSRADSTVYNACEGKVPTASELLIAQLAAEITV